MGLARPSSLLLLLAFAVLWFWGRPRLLPADHPWAFTADPLPAELRTTAEQSRAYADTGGVWSIATLEKVVLMGLLSVIFAQTLPGVDATSLQLFFGIAAVVVVNAAFTLALARRSRTLQSIALTVVARTVANVALVAAAEGLVHGPRGGSIDAGATLFFLTMVSLLTTLHDHWYPVMESRVPRRTRGPTSRRWRLLSPSGGGGSRQPVVDDLRAQHEVLQRATFRVDRAPQQPDGEHRAQEGASH